MHNHKKKEQKKKKKLISIESNVYGLAKCRAKHQNNLNIGYLDIKSLYLNSKSQEGVS